MSFSAEAAEIRFEYPMSTPAARRSVPCVSRCLKSRWSQSPWRADRSNRDYDADLAAILRAFAVEWVVLAGWMHILSESFLTHFPSRVVNLHPALPGTFPGTHAIERAYEAYRRGKIHETGVMVHYVPDEDIDDGPVIVQERVPIHAADTLDDLEARIHAVEHALYVRAIGIVLGIASAVPKGSG